MIDPRANSLGCAGCGGCCEDLVLSFDPRKKAEWADHPDHAEWLAAGDKGAQDVQFFAEGHWQVEWADDHKWPGRTTYIATCTAYDAENRRCTIHEDRPPICRDYPNYERWPSKTNRHPDAEERLHRVEGVASCSYYLDHPGWSELGARPLLPLTVLHVV